VLCRAGVDGTRQRKGSKKRKEMYHRAAMTVYPNTNATTYLRADYVVDSFASIPTSLILTTRLSWLLAADADSTNSYHQLPPPPTPTTTTKTKTKTKMVKIPAETGTAQGDVVASWRRGENRSILPPLPPFFSTLQETNHGVLAEGKDGGGKRGQGYTG
jgi:hypothetical protein